MEKKKTIAEMAETISDFMNNLNFGEKEAILTSVYCVNLIAAVKGTYGKMGVKKNRIEIDTDVAMMITHHMAGISHLVKSMLDDGAFDELAE